MGSEIQEGCTQKRSQVPIRVLVGKIGLDGHDRGAKVVSSGLRNEGMEVIYTGIRQSVESIVQIAVQEDVDVVGLSSLSGAHDLFLEVVEELRKIGKGDTLVIGGGIIPDEDVPFLKERGVSAIFGPGARISDIANYIRENIKRKI
jgi:methylmalonyl-CoA mutase C-terminal domain/subunit